MPEPKINPGVNETCYTDQQGKALPIRKFQNRGDSGQKFAERNRDNSQSDERDQAVHLLNSDQSTAEFPNRGPNLAPGHASENGKRAKSEMVNRNSDPGERNAKADFVPPMPVRTWQEIAGGKHHKMLEKLQGGYSPNPHSEQTGAEDRLEKGEVEEDTP